MAPFDELQALWQSQPARPAARLDPAVLAGEFRRYGRRQDIINTFKAVLIGVVLVQAVVTLRHRPAPLFALTLMLCCGVLALVAEWRNQRAIARFDFSAPSVAFVRATIARLHAQRNPLHTREFAILFGAVFVGYNVMVFASYGKWGLRDRVLGHLFSVVLPAAIYAAGRLVRARRWNSECRPLIDRLTLLLNTLEERAQ